MLQTRSLPDFSGLTYSILTREAGPELRGIHTRQPILLAPSSYGEWLAGAGLGDVEQIEGTRITFHPDHVSPGSSFTRSSAMWGALEMKGLT
jgi:hypothetical protein